MCSLSGEERPTWLSQYVWHENDTARCCQWPCESKPHGIQRDTDRQSLRSDEHDSSMRGEGAAGWVLGVSDGAYCEPENKCFASAAWESMEEGVASSVS